MPPKPLHHRVVIKRLQKLGFEIVNQKGSHLKMRRFFLGKKYTVIIPIHNY
ncbi:type II toxin-antitoxin system HicA family toxin [bacterium]|nr:type II toxin-antitoxin system HicA family toxin [FCB group bacterium]MBL7191817.1 type II toxin-antitoxin system HicA family toxin [bacterium]